MAQEMVQALMSSSLGATDGASALAWVQEMA